MRNDAEMVNGQAMISGRFPSSFFFLEISSSEFRIETEEIHRSHQFSVVHHPARFRLREMWMKLTAPAEEPGR
jgi:hypothetical protein